MRLCRLADGCSYRCASFEAKVNYRVAELANCQAALNEGGHGR